MSETPVDELPAEFDGPWKEALDQELNRFLAFFFSAAHAHVDWQRDHESLDAELQKLRPEAERGLRRADRLVKLWLKGNGGEFAVLHAEVQCQHEADFAHRQHVYNYRAEDRY